MGRDEQQIAARLLALGRHAEDLFPVLVPQAGTLVRENPYAFCLATCLDRGTKAELIWTIPYWIKEELGHLDPYRIYQMPIHALADLIRRLPKKPRYVNAAPRTIQDITRIVVEQFNGDAAGIWKGREASDVHQVFLSVYGVGLGIANMAVLLIEKGYGIRFSDVDHSRMDIKPDVHTMRVLHRLGVASAVQEDAAIAAARHLNPSYPGELDGALWRIGREWCTSNGPLCGSCPLNNVCERRSVHRQMHRT